MSGVNKYTEQALERYVQMENPQFAALISGEWGTGKTWFVKNFFATHEFSKKFCYISLFDIKTLKDLDTALIEQINQSRSAKAIRITSKITRFAIEKYVGGDWECVENLINQLANKVRNGIIICFDDIERTTLSTTILIGYISNLLEQFDANIILICNINKIKKFDRLCEKIIGIRLSVEKDVASFLRNSIEYIQNIGLKEFLHQNNHIIIEYFNHYNLHNLRQIRTLIYYFESLYNHTRHNKNQNYLTSLLISLCDALFYRYSNEIKNQKNLEIESTWEDTSFKNKILTENNILCPVLKRTNTSFWNSFFASGVANTNILENDFNKSLYNPQNKNTPLRLWNYHFLEDRTVISLYKTMRSEFENNEYKNVDIFLHATGLIIEMKRCAIEKKEINFDYFKQIIDTTKFRVNIDFINMLKFSSYSCYEYRQSKDELFIKVKEYIIQKCTDLIKEKITHIFKLIITKAEKINYKALEMKIRSTDYAININDIDPESFISTITKYKNSTIIDIIDILISITSKNTPAYLDWIAQSLIITKQEVEKIKETHPIKFMAFERLIDHFENVLQS